MKHCSTCKEQKPLSEFGTQSRVLKDGIKVERPKSRCNECRRKFEKLSPEKRIQYNAKASIQRKERIEKMTPEEKEEAKQKHNAWQTAWRKNHPETYRALKKRYIERHKEAIAEKKARDAKTPHGKELERARYKKYYANNFEVISERAKQKRKELHPSYVKGLLFRGKLPAHLIPNELIELRKVYTQIKRHTKENAT